MAVLKSSTLTLYCWTGKWESEPSTQQYTIEKINPDSNNTISNWEYIVKKHGRSLPEEENESFNARSAPRRFKTSLVSNETKQKICRISAIDYCCLNIALPTECSDIGIHCSLDQNKLGFQIQPWQHPHEID